LSGGAGFAEVVIDLASGARVGRPKSTITVYFLKPDGTSALDPPPTDVKMDMGANQAVTLTPSANPSQAGGFSSPPGQYGGMELTGDLSATIGGQAVTVPIVIR